ncbi:hypothetical protein [Methylobacterium sp. WL19]|nr:hypothetical protein [Methylobacterium sp. WL19]
MPANDNVAPVDMTALALFVVAVTVLIAVPAASLWLWSVWS